MANWYQMAPANAATNAAFSPATLRAQLYPVRTTTSEALDNNSLIATR